jgi:hypothetical protein
MREFNDSAADQSIMNGLELLDQIAVPAVGNMTTTLPCSSFRAVLSAAPSAAPLE